MKIKIALPYAGRRGTKLNVKLKLKRKRICAPPAKPKLERKINGKDKAAIKRMPLLLPFFVIELN
jgi:hypothetical protein